MAKSKITLYVDIVSPFAYLGYYMLRHHPIFQGVEVSYVPILLGGLMKACNNTPPIQIKNKDKWISAERLRWAQQFNIPVTNEVPVGFPILTLAAMRALSCVQIKYPEQLVGCLDALFESHWVNANAEVGKPEGIRAVLEKVLGAGKADEVLKGAASPEAKKRLLENTEESFRIGAFGLPWFQCTNEKGEVQGFWGFDHLGQVIRFLGLDKGNDAGLRALL
ncbi:hypothetical protein DV736_g121, partial [Chaetothyriales sp. CBS 134916]